MNLDDKALFLDAMEDVQPLKRRTDVHWQPTRNLKAPQRIDTLQLDNFLTTGFLDILPLNEPLEFRREGLQQGLSTNCVVANTRSRPASICYASRLRRAGKCCSDLLLKRRKKACVMS